MVKALISPLRVWCVCVCVCVCVCLVSEGSRFGAPGSQNWDIRASPSKVDKTDTTGQLIKNGHD
jgi:hypothetical protein